MPVVAFDANETIDQLIVFVAVLAPEDPSLGLLAGSSFALAGFALPHATKVLSKLYVLLERRFGQIDILILPLFHRKWCSPFGEFCPKNMNLFALLFHLFEDFAHEFPATHATGISNRSLLLSTIAMADLLIVISVLGILVLTRFHIVRRRGTKDVFIAVFIEISVVPRRISPIQVGLSMLATKVVFQSKATTKGGNGKQGKPLGWFQVRQKYISYGNIGGQTEQCRHMTTNDAGAVVFRVVQMQIADTLSDL